MQVVSYKEEKLATDYLTRLEQEQEEQSAILHFALPGALPEGYTLALNTTLGTLSYLRSNEQGARMLMQQQFTFSELSVLRPLLESFPYYCPYEDLFASFYNGTVTDAVVLRCRQRLQRALREGTWEQAMRPVRNVLSRTRLKLRTFGFNISSILETGYILMVSPQFSISTK
jgi:hypothetical protein